jgi:hypothetical protein
VGCNGGVAANHLQLQSLETADAAVGFVNYVFISFRSLTSGP